MNRNQSNKVIFPKIKSVGKRNWGKEELLVLIPKKISLKKILIKKGKKGGLQFHHKKNECGILIYGKLKITYDDGKEKNGFAGQMAYFTYFNYILNQNQINDYCNKYRRILTKYQESQNKGYTYETSCLVTDSDTTSLST